MPGPASLWSCHKEPPCLPCPGPWSIIPSRAAELQASRLNTTEENPAWHWSWGVLSHRDGQPRCTEQEIFRKMTEDPPEWRDREEWRAGVSLSEWGWGLWQERKLKSKEKYAAASWTPPAGPGASRHGLPGRDDPDWLRDKPRQAPRSESRSRYSGKMGLFIT